MTYYRITKVEECEVCNGIGLIEEPGWSRFNKSFTHRDYGDLTQWGKEQGWKTDSIQKLTELWFSEQGYGEIPPEEVRCSHCHGEREITTEVSLSEALRDLGVIQDNHRGGIYDGNI